MGPFRDVWRKSYTFLFSLNILRTFGNTYNNPHCFDNITILRTLAVRTFLETLENITISEKNIGALSNNEDSFDLLKECPPTIQKRVEQQKIQNTIEIT